MHTQPAPPSFAISPPAPLAWRMLVLLGGVLPLGILCVLWVERPPLQGVRTRSW